MGQHRAGSRAICINTHIAGALRQVGFGGIAPCLMDLMAPCYNRTTPMQTDADKPKVAVEELAKRFGSDLISVTAKFSYFSLLPIAEEDLRQYLNDPIAAISPA